MAHIFISCSEAARKISRAQDAPLTTGERWRLSIHLALCRLCRRYAKQVKFLRHTLRHFPEHLEEVVPGGLSPQARQRIIRSLQASE